MGYCSISDWPCDNCLFCSRAKSIDTWDISEWFSKSVQLKFKADGLARDERTTGLQLERAESAARLEEF